MPQPRRIDYVIERLGVHGWFAEVLPYHPARRFPTLYLIGCGGNASLIKRVWFEGFDDSPASIALQNEILDWLFETTKDLKP